MNKIQKLIPAAHLYKWRSNTIWVIAVLVFIGHEVDRYMRFGNQSHEGTAEKIGWILDIVVGVGFYILILWVIFTIRNWIYKKMKVI